MLERAAGPWGRLCGLGPAEEVVADPRTVLFVRPDHIGDFVTTLPALALARQTWPQATTVALVGRWSAPLARLAPAVDEVLVTDCPWWLSARGLPPAPLGWAMEAEALVRSLRRRPVDVAFDFRGDLRQILWFLWRTHARVRVASTRTGGAALLTHPVEHRPDEHVTAEALRLVRAAGAPSSPPPAPPYLEEDAQANAVVEGMLGQAGLPPEERLAVVHPGARRPIKAWPAERFAAVVDRLRALGLRSVLVGEEQDRCATVARTSTADPLDLGGRVTLPGMVSLFRRARLFVGSDSGLQHLATACGVPTLALFGPTSADRFGPYGEGHRVAQRSLACRPCWHRICPYTASGEAKCLLDLEVAEVLGHLEHLLA